MSITRISSIILILSSLSLLVYAAYNSVKIIDIVCSGERVEAEIIRSDFTFVRVGRQGRFAYLLTLSYTDKHGVTHEVYPPINDEVKRQKGESVMIYYNSNAPDEVILDTWSSKYAPTALPTFIGLSFLVVGCLLLRDSRKSN